MKKFISLFIATAVLLSVLVAFPVFAEGDTVYKKDAVIKATVVMPSTNSFVGVEGKLTYDSTKLAYVQDSFSAPNVSNMKYNDTVSGEIPFNCSSLSAYDVTSDHAVMSAQFTVLEDTTAAALSSVIDDAYILDTDGTTFINANTTNRVDIEIIQDAPASSIRGDVNKSGAVDNTDLVLLRRYCAGFTSTAIDLAAADINGDNNINNTDLVLLRRHCAGFETNFAIGEEIA